MKRLDIFCLFIREFTKLMYTKKLKEVKFLVNVMKPLLG